MRLNSSLFSSVSTRSFVFGAVIVFACVAFIFTGFGSLRVANLFGPNANTAAQVGAQTITMAQFSNQLSSQGLSRYPESERKGIEQQILNQMIAKQIMVEQAQALGWFAKDVEIAVLIKTVPFFQDPATKKFSMEKFKNYIASQQMSDVDFYNDLRQELELQKIQNLLFMPTAQAPSVVNAQYKINNTEFYLQYAAVEPGESYVQSKVTEKTAAFLADPKNKDQLQSVYQAQKSRYDTPAQFKVQSILVSYKTAQRAQGAALSRTKDQALVQVQKIKDQIKSEKDFQKQATKDNDDLVAKQNQGSLGFVDASLIDPESFKAIALLTKKAPLSGVVDTPFGFRLFFYQDSKPEVHKTFDQVKADIAKQIVQGQIKQDTSTSLKNEVSKALLAHNVSKLNELVNAYQISWKYLPKSYKVTDPYLADLGQTTDLATKIFELKKPGDMLFQLVDFGSGKQALVKLVSRKDPAAPSAQEQDELAKSMARSESQAYAESTQKQLLESYQKQGKIVINPMIKGNP